VKRDPFGLVANPPVVGRVVTATITLVCVLIVYDGWASLKLFDVVLIVVGPIVAVFTSHIFSSHLVQQVDLGRRPTLREWLATARFEARFLLLAIPPLLVLFVLDFAGVALTDSIRAIVVLEAISLGFWAGSGRLVCGAAWAITRTLRARRPHHRRHRAPAPGDASARQSSRGRRRGPLRPSEPGPFTFAHNGVTEFPAGE
jgi:hypothetical protein